MNSIASFGKSALLPMQHPGAPDKIVFTMRESPRARRMRMVVHASGLEVVVPKGARRDLAEKFVESNRDWAMRTLTKICGKVHVLPKDTYPDLPLFARLFEQPPPPIITTINLRSMEKIYEVNYIRVPMLNGLATILPPSDTRKRQITIYCSKPDHPPHAAVARALKEWLREKAKAFLPEYVNQIADEIGMKRPTQIRVGFQRTVWGSRSTSGRISLNAPLLFMPPDLLRHVIIHELCHVIHMDHSTKFKNLLKKLDPDAERLSKALNKAETYIPSWIHSSTML